MVAGLVAGVLGLVAVALLVPGALGTGTPKPGAVLGPAVAGPLPESTRESPLVSPEDERPDSVAASELAPRSVRPAGKLRGHPATVPETGPGRYRRARLNLPAAGRTGRLIRYDVSVEKNLHLDPKVAAKAVAQTLNDARSWRGSGRWRFQLVSSARRADVHTYLVTPGTTDRLCYPLLTRGAVSCQNGDRVIRNAKRWLRGARAYGSDLIAYRHYLVNHEFGHFLGHQHLGCPAPGRLAPVMMQQTKGLGSCRKNPWPLAAGD